MSAMGELAKLRARAEAGDADAALELCRRIAAGKYVLMREREWHALRAHYREICRAGRAPIRRIYLGGSRHAAHGSHVAGVVPPIVPAPPTRRRTNPHHAAGAASTRRSFAATG